MTFPRVVSFIRDTLQRQSGNAVDEAALAAALAEHMPGRTTGHSYYWHVWQALLQLEAEGVVKLVSGRGWQLTQSYPETFPVPVYPDRSAGQTSLFGETAA